MIAQAKDPTLAMRCPSPLVLFGIDHRGKPKAARFGKQHADLAIKAATQLQLQVLMGNDPKIADLTAELSTALTFSAILRSSSRLVSALTTPARTTLTRPRLINTAVQGYHVGTALSSDHHSGLSVIRRARRRPAARLAWADAGAIPRSAQGSHYPHGLLLSGQSRLRR